MSMISSFFKSPDAARNIDLLFSTVRSGASQPLTGYRFPSSSASAEITASQRALSRIIEIITLNASQPTAKASMDEKLGYVTAGTGSEGDDALTVTGRGIANIDSGEGNDTLTLKSNSISDIRTGNGNDVIKAAGSFVSSVDGGDGNDDIQLKATLALAILGGAGKDVMKVAANTIRDLDGGDGDDTLTLEGNRIFARGGAGNDQVSLKATGRNAYMEYGFGRGDGQDVIRSSAPLSLALGALAANELNVVVSGNSLTASVKGSQDTITVTLEDETAATYRFTVKDGQTMLVIG
ncbi:RTX toxin [Rhizobium helianthi]|uniref:RTX toxin n=1 Tax=Rhizobium helianthi TaxID=1132695 RepID=A0ABW4M3W2_9HYPH